MRRRVIVILYLLTIVITSCGEKNKKTAEQTLKEFYTQYITECDKTPYNLETLTAIKEFFLTKELIQKLGMVELNYDPLLNAQDCDKAWIETLKITPVTQHENTYQICYSYNDLEGEHTNCVTLLLVQIDGKYLINNIENFSTNITINEKLYTSDIRPNEQLELRKTYTDHLEYIDYRDSEYRNLIILKKDNKEIPLFDDCPDDDETITMLHNGDMVKILWRIDSFYHEGYGGVWVGEYAEKIIKINTNWDSLYHVKMSNELKKFELHQINDTIVQDLNGDNNTEKIFLSENKNIIIVDGKTNIQTKFDDNGYNEFDWINIWGITTDEETYQILLDNDGDISGEETVPLFYPSIFVRKYENGGGIITFDKQKYIWIHQND